jgi:O-antigen ligase
MAFNKPKIDIAFIHVFFTCMLVAFIPYAVSFLSWILICWLASAIVLMVRERKILSTVKFNFALLISMLLYLVFVAGVFYSENMHAAIFDVQMKLSLFIIPPFIFLLRDFYKKYFNGILLTFVIANVAAGLICICFAFYHSLSFQNGSLVFDINVPGVYEDTHTEFPTYFAYSDFSVFKHPTYFSMYITLSFFTVIYFLNNAYYFLKNTRRNKLLYFVIMAFLVLLIYFLKSKAAFITLFLFTMLYIIIYVIKKKKFLIGGIVIGCLILLSIIGFRNNSRFYYVKSAISNISGLTDAIQRKDFQFIVDRYGVDRIPIWMLSSEIISENFLIGVGSGDVSDNLMIKYKKYNLQYFESNKFNAHNQYFETFVALGIIGFLIFVTWLFYPIFLKRNYHRGRFLILILVGILMINFLFESALNTISGVMFVAFFYSFLFHVPTASLKSNKGNLN